MIRQCALAAAVLLSGAALAEDQPVDPACAAASERMLIFIFKLAAERGKEILPDAATPEGRSRIARQSALSMQRDGIEACSMVLLMPDTTLEALARTVAAEKDRERAKKDGRTP